MGAADKLAREPGLPTIATPMQVGWPQLLLKLRSLLPLYVDGINHSLDGYQTRLTTLPTADATHQGRVVVHQGGGAGGRDRLVVCLKSASGTYSWVQVADGGA
jgi:hypothetical protein